jgi:hypothetical protein
MDKLVYIAIGAALVGGGWFSYLAATKGLPAAWAWLRAKWNAAKNEVAALKADLGSIETRVRALEQQAVSAVAVAPAAAVAAAVAPAVAPPAPIVPPAEVTAPATAAS